MNPLSKTLVVIAVIVLVVGLAVGGYVGGWWLKADSTNRTTEIFNDSDQRQQALVNQAGDLVADINDIDVQITTATPETKAALQAQRKAVVTQFCETIGGVNDTVTVPATTSAAQAKECS